MTTYSHAEIEMIVNMASENPRGFMSLVKNCIDSSPEPSVSIEEVERSLKAWGINPYSGQALRPTRKDAKSSSYRSSRRRENNRDKELPV